MISRACPNNRFIIFQYGKLPWRKCISQRPMGNNGWRLCLYGMSLLTTHLLPSHLSLSLSLLSIVPSLMLHHQTAISQLSLTRSYSSRTRIDSHLRHFWDFHLQAQSIRLLRNVSMHFIGTLNAVDIWLLFKLLFGYYNSNRRWQEQQHQPSNAVCIYMILEWHASWGHRNALMAYTESVMTYMCMNGTCNDN